MRICVNTDFCLAYIDLHINIVTHILFSYPNIYKIELLVVNRTEQFITR